MNGSGTGDAEGVVANDRNVEELVLEAAREAFENAADGDKPDSGYYDLSVTVEVDVEEVSKP